MTEVFVDGIILPAQGNASKLSKLQSTLFDVIDEVFRATNSQDTDSSRKKPISLKSWIREIAPGLP